MPHAHSRSASFGWILLVYVIACGVTWLVIAAFPSAPVRGLVVGLLASVAVTYVASLLLGGNGSVFDPWWSVLPPVAALALVETWTPLSVACVVVVFVWAARLTLNWAVGWSGLGHEDWRYPLMYARAPVPRWLTLLVGVQLVPAIFVTLGCLPLVHALRHGGELGVLGLLATALGLFAAGLELAADEQRRAHAAAKPGALMDVGLWAWCRHPNYLGEILFWVSLWLFGMAAAPGAAWWTMIGPLSIAGLFAFASIPLMETRNAERRPGWAEYVARTPRLLPRPPRRP